MSKSNIKPFESPRMRAAVGEAVERMERQKQAAEALPVCPYCKADPVTYSIRQIDAGPWRLAQIFCGNVKCRRIFVVQVVGANSQRPEPSSIIMPHA